MQIGAVGAAGRERQTATVRRDAQLTHFALVQLQRSRLTFHVDREQLAGDRVRQPILRQPHDATHAALGRVGRSAQIGEPAFLAGAGRVDPDVAKLAAGIVPGERELARIRRPRELIGHGADQAALRDERIERHRLRAGGVRQRRRDTRQHERHAKCARDATAAGLGCHLCESPLQHLRSVHARRRTCSARSRRMFASRC